MSYKDTIAEAKRKAGGGSADVSESVALGIATATQRPRRALPGAEVIAIETPMSSPTPRTTPMDRPSPIPSNTQQKKENSPSMLPLPAARAKPDRQGVDFGQGRLEVIKDAIRFLERRGIKTGAKMGASIIVGAALDRFLPTWRSDPEAFAQIMREHIEGRDAAFTAAFPDYMDETGSKRPMGR